MSWQNGHLKTANFSTSSKGHFFSPPPNSKGTKKYKSYTRNSFRPGHRADLHLEHRNRDTELALCSASRSDSIKLYLSFHPAHSFAGDQPHPGTDRSFHTPTSPSFRALWSGVTLTSGEQTYFFFFLPVCCVFTFGFCSIGNLLKVSFTCKLYHRGFFCMIKCRIIKLIINHLNQAYLFQNRGFFHSNWNFSWMALLNWQLPQTGSAPKQHLREGLSLHCHDQELMTVWFKCSNIML